MIGFPDLRGDPLALTMWRSLPLVPVPTETAKTGHGHIVSRTMGRGNQGSAVRRGNVV